MFLLRSCQILILDFSSPTSHMAFLYAKFDLKVRLFLSSFPTLLTLQSYKLFGTSIQTITTMHLETLHQFSPQQHALFLHPKANLLCAHESTDYFAFASRNNEVVLHNTKTGRSSIIIASQNGIAALCFTNQYLLVVEYTVHEVLAFSLRNEKLKKKVTGHRTQVSKLAYCRHLGLIASLSHDQLIVVNQSNFAREKMIKCSTSTFADCQFTLAGNVLATLFIDGSLYLWNPEDYSHRESGLAYKGLRIALNSSSTLAVYNTEKLFLADLSKQTVIYQQIDRFWKGQIQEVNFINGYLAVNTDSSFFVADIQLNHQFVLKGAKEYGEIDSFAVAQYQSVLIFVANKLKRITFARFAKDLEQLAKTRDKSPLTNEGLVCAGGYSKKQGCFLAQDVQTTNNYQEVAQQVQPIHSINYEPLNTAFSRQKLREFIRKHHFLPDKHRPMAYKYLLKLPISPQQFRVLQQKGRHECAALLDAKYPLENKDLSFIMKDMISLLAHYSPVFAQAEFVPTLIFPFVCMFGNDQFLCFEVLYRLFTRPLSFLFKEFPVANSAYLQNIREILAQSDPQLLNHFTSKGLSFTKTCWTLLTSLFSACLARQHFLAVIDSLFVRIDEPQYIIYLLLGFLTYNKARILTIENDGALTAFLDQQQSIHLGKFLGTVDKIASKFADKVRYPFQTVGLEDKAYMPLAKIPPDALKMYENKRRILTEQLMKRHEQEKNRDDMLKEMEVLAIAAKREAERQAIQRQAYDLHCENEAGQTLTFKPRGDSDRIARIEHLIDQLSLSLETDKSKKQIFKNYLPSVTNLQLQSNEDLDKMQLKLSKLLTQIKPQQNNHYLKSQPLAIKKQAISDFPTFKAAVNTRLAGQLWDLQANSQSNKLQRWQNNMLSSLNH